MYMKTMIIFLIMDAIGNSYTVTMEANKLIQSICDQLNDNNTLDVQEDQQWNIICQELSRAKENQQYIDNDFIENDIPRNRRPRKAIVRAGSSIRSSGSRASSSGSRASSSGSRTGSSGNRISSSSSSSSSRYINTQNGARYNRPSGSLWSRSSVSFLLIATRFGRRQSSSSSRFTTSATNPTGYYYCTSNDNSLIEIQCSTTDGDNDCCEDTNHEVSCCGGDVPDYIEQDMSRAVQTIARIFYTIAILALFMHLFTRINICL